ncbi:MAG: hypothetical protein ISR85_00745 [Kiritimatiellales bacterium]|nr:hypothetical protein [Kiritimatiellota bacterium]MBL7011439.1 hypothetical protein [Kiritimatiellales bacterium]
MIRILILLTVILALLNPSLGAQELLGRFDLRHDLFLAHFDLKTDVDDIHSVAATATLLNDPRFAGVNYHAVAGAYGIQEGLYVPADKLFELAFEGSWSDAHTDFSNALEEVSKKAVATLNQGGTIWIAEAGQSDFSAALVRKIQGDMPDLNVKKRIHIVQHADWNEEVTTPDDLAFLKKTITYHKIPDGNAAGNGTPGFRSDELINWKENVGDAKLIKIWEMAIGIANTYNGIEGRYLNESIQKGGLDFSDVAESTWIFGFVNLVDANDFFSVFSTSRK